MCLYPKLIDNPKYKATKKNGGNIPPITDIRVKKVPIGCGNCIECRKRKSREWQTRLLEDIRHNKNAYFITLTFSEEKLQQVNNQIPEQIKGYERDNAIATYAVRHFLEIHRKHYKTSIRHWLTTELGHSGTERLHLHGLVWTDRPIKQILNHWKYGHSFTGTFVNEKTINYIVKYIYKRDDKHKEYKSIILTSPGIGKGYFNRTDVKKNEFNGKDTKETYTTRQGTKIALPIYYRNKIYTEHQREQLWLHKLDKNERWICGEKIDISTKEGNLAYYNILEHYRRENWRLGYGNDEINWDRKKYEEQRRQLQHEKNTTKPKIQKSIHLECIDDWNKFKSKWKT